MADTERTAKPTDLTVLVPYRGEKPDAPQWFSTAIETPYETRFVDVEGAKIRYQRWGDASKPGLFLVHGNGAHAHWYDFIAPYFAEDYCVVAMTFGGMGDSGWRERYPMIVAHSFGGFITMNTGSRFGERFAGMVIVDSPIRPPEEEWDGPPRRADRLDLEIRPNHLDPVRCHGKAC